MQLGHVVEVHAVDAGNDGQRHKDDGDDGQDAHLLVHAVGLEGKVDVHHAQHHVARGVERFEKLHVVIVHVAQIDGGLAFENGEIDAHGKLIEHVAQRQERAAKADGIAFEAVDFAENVAVFIFKQGFVYGFDAVVVLFQNDEIVVHDAVEQAIGEKGGVFTEDAARVFAHLAAQLAEQPQRFLLERQHEILADNQIHLVGIQFAGGGVVVNLRGDKQIIVIVFDFGALFAAEDVFDDQLVDAVRFQRVFEQRGVVDADEMQPVGLPRLRAGDVGQFFTREIIVLGKRIGGIKRLMDGGTRRVVGIAARDSLVLRDFCGYCLGSGWCVRHD